MGCRYGCVFFAAQKSYRPAVFCHHRVHFNRCGQKFRVFLGQHASSSRMSGWSVQNCSPIMSQWCSCTLLLLRVTSTSFSSSFGSFTRLVTVSSRWRWRRRNTISISKNKKLSGMVHHFEKLEALWNQSTSCSRKSKHLHHPLYLMFTILFFSWTKQRYIYFLCNSWSWKFLFLCLFNYFFKSKISSGSTVWFWALITAVCLVRKQSGVMAENEVTLCCNLSSSALCFGSRPGCGYMLARINASDSLLVEMQREADYIITHAKEEKEEMWGTSTARWCKEVEMGVHYFFFNCS